MDDKTANKLLEENIALKKQLAQQKKLFINTIGRSLDGLMILDADGIILYANKASIKLLNKNIGDVIGESLGIPLTTEETMEIVITNNENNHRHIELNITYTSWENQSAYLVTLRDITQHKKAKEELAHLSENDELTGLLNRRALSNNIDQITSEADLSKSKLAVIYLDLDKFKQINDQYGHDAGDKLLKQTAKIFKESIRSSDFISRVGGDEFIIILTEINSIQDIKHVTEKICKKLEKPIDIGKRSITQEASIGISIYPDDGKDINQLITYADRAMYSSKHTADTNCIFYSRIKNIKP